MMYTPKGLFTIIKINAILSALYCGIRMSSAVWYFTEVNRFGLTVIFIAAAGLGFYFTKNIWLKKGVYFMTFLLMFFVSDLICLLLTFFCNLWKVNAFINVWLAGGVGIIAGILFFIYGLCNERRFRKNTIGFKSDKVNKTLRFAVLSDIHFGTVQPPKVLDSVLEKINRESYDGVILVGDIVEEHTKKEDMKLLFSLLKKLKSTYGTFFVHGNHDRQEGLKGERTFSDEEFDSLMAIAGIKNIDDTVVEFKEGVQLIGRKDYSFSDRMDVPKLLEKSDSQKFRIVAEHQPTEIEEISQHGIELCLAAHYHGAQTWPNNIIYKLSGIHYNGKYKVGNMLNYVTAGITGSKYIIRTHGHCEYLEVIIAPDELKN